MGSPIRDHAAEVRGVVAEHLPECRIDSVALLGEGQDNIAYEVNGELIVRFSKESDSAARAARVRREAALLMAVADVSLVPVPQPRFIRPELGCLAYFKVPGVPLIDLPATRRSTFADSIAAALGCFLGALHAAPVDRFTDLVDIDYEPAAQWLAEAAQLYESILDEVPPAHRPAIERFLATPPPTGQPELVFSHNDLGIEHVLVEPKSGTISGVIDFTDAAITDPAYDFGLIYRDLGPTALDAALRNYRNDTHDRESLRARATLYAQCSVLEDLAYGLETAQPQYLDAGRAALTWLYPSA